MMRRKAGQRFTESSLEIQQTGCLLEAMLVKKMSEYVSSNIQLDALSSAPVLNSIVSLMPKGPINPVCPEQLM